MSEQPTCTVCGEPMPDGEEMFKFHGYSGPCPKPPLQNPRIDTSDTMCALVCMLVSNPGDAERPEGWQKRVNGLIRALRDERNSLQQRRALIEQRFHITYGSLKDGTTAFREAALAQLSKAVEDGL